MARKIYGHKREEVTGEWRKLHNEGDQIRKDIGGACSTYCRQESCIQGFIDKT